MRFGKVKMFFLVNGLIAVILLLYFAPWLFSSTVIGHVTNPFTTTVINVSYEVDGLMYIGTYMRNGIELSQRFVSIRYLDFRPETSRINSFMGMYAEPLAWWSVFALASAMLLLTHNTVFSKGTIFQIHKKSPWISMEEYFPISNRWFRWRKKYKAPTENTSSEQQLLPKK